MKKFLWLLLFVCNILHSQTVLKGHLSDSKGNPIPNASILINKKSTNDIIAYSVSDSKGFYAISLTSSYNEIDIQVLCMGFLSTTETIENKTQTKDFKLLEKEFELNEIIVKSSPIKKIGDTINYSVRSFSKEQDRSIGDVLKRLPGIEVLSDGKVLYQGKPINKYYIEGLDLLEGKYNLANENLPHKEVTQVQILENHQPIKALDSLKFSDNAAINIKLKNAYTFTGQAKLATGISPLLWETNITPMLFTKKKQLLVTYQSNNTGDNIAIQLKKLTIEDLMNQFENNSDKTDWLAIQQLNNPNFSEKRWLKNNAHLVSLNYLQKLKKEYELRVSTSYLNDYQQQNGKTYTQFITPSNTINILEEKYNQIYYNSLQTDFTLQRNASKNYFKNSFEFQGFWDNQRGNITLNNDFLKQDLKNHYFRFSNSLKSLFPVGSQMLTLNSYIGFNQTPQTLTVNPGQFEAILNNNETYQEVNQQVNLQTFYTNNSFSLTKGYKQFSFESKIGFQLENQNLNTQIATSENTSLSNDFSNNLDWMRSKTYIELQSQYKKNKWRVELTTPLNIQSFKIEDSPLQKKQNLNKITFEPRLSVTYEINTFWKLNSSAGVSKQFGTINQLHYAYILQNYRNIQRIDTSLPQTVNQNKAIGISYRNPIKMLFWNIIYMNTISKNNLLYQTQFSSNGTSELQALEQNNDKINHNITTRASKYLSKIKTNITLNGSLGLQKFQQILNTNLSDVKNENWTVGNKIETDITDGFSIEYQSTWAFSKNKIQNQHNPTITQQNHIFNLNFTPKDNQYFAIKSEYVNSKLFSERNENLFTDLIYRYTIKEKKIDLELQLNNLFNTTNYKTININDFSYVETNFNLRPRQFLFKIRFTL